MHSSAHWTWQRRNGMLSWDPKALTWTPKVAPRVVEGSGFRYGLGVYGLGCTWTPKVCRIIAFCEFWAMILPTFGGFR